MDEFCIAVAATVFTVVVVVMSMIANAQPKAEHPNWEEVVDDICQQAEEDTRQW